MSILSVLLVLLAGAIIGGTVVLLLLVRWAVTIMSDK